MADDRTSTASEELLCSLADEGDPVLSVVLPTLNEEAGIRECIANVKQAIADLGVETEIIVSDSSTDRTPEIARELGAIVVEPDGEGYGNAYCYAFERARGEYVAMGDADMTYDFTELPKLFRPVAEGDADVVLGSRFDGEIKPGAMPALHKYVGNPLLTRFLNVFYDAEVSDAHSGFRVVSREAIETLELRSGGMEFASEMVMAASEKGLAIEEVPITYHERAGDATLDSFRDGWRHVKFMLMNAPGYLFSVPALVFGVLGVLTLLASYLGANVAGLTFRIQTAIAGCVLTIVAVQLASLAMFSAVATDPIRQPRDPLTSWFLDQFQLEHGATIGIAFALLGGGYVVYTVSNWIASGYATLPDVVSNILAMTAIVVGMQVVFYSFFLSMLAQHTPSPNEDGV